MSYFSLLVTLIFVIFNLSLGGCKDKKNQAPNLVRSVKTLVITSTSAIGSRQLTGILKPSDESDLSFQVGGTVNSVDVKLGDSVKKDQVLAIIDPRDFELKLQSVQAALKSAKVDVATASEELKRQTILQKKDYASKAILEKAQSQYEFAISKEKIEISRIEEATRDLDRTKLKAPFDGKISLRSIDPHQEIQAGRVVLKIQSAQGLKVEVLVPESLIRDIEPQQAIKVEFPTLKGVKIPGVIREIGTQSDAGNAFPVTVDLSQTNVDLRPGMSAQIIFDKPSPKGETPVYLIPLTAIDTRPKENRTNTSDKNASVFLFDEKNSKIISREVSIQEIQGNLIEVTKGLKEGDILVTAGVPFLEDGQRVTQWKPKYRSPETDQ